MSAHLSNVTGVERRNEKNTYVNFLSIFLLFFPSSTRLSVCLSSARGWFTLQSTLRRSWSRKWSCRKPSEETWYAARLAVWRRRRCRRKRPREWRVCLPGRTRAPCTTAWWSWVTPWEPAPLLSCPSCSGLSTPPSTATLTLRPVASSGESPAYRSGEAALERVSHPLPACLRRKLLNARLASSLALIPLCLEAARVPDRFGCFPTGRCVGQKSNTGTLCGEEQASFFFFCNFCQFCLAGLERRPALCLTAGLLQRRAVWAMQTSLESLLRDYRRLQSNN